MKFKVYDKVWVLQNEEVHRYVVFQRSEKVVSTQKIISGYYLGETEAVESPANWMTFPEHKLFATKQELIDSL